MKMYKSTKLALAASLLLGVAAPAFAADPYYPPEPAPVAAPVYQEEFGGWYIRGDIDYHKTKLDGAHYTLYAEPNGGDRFDFTDLDDTGSLGAGVGYQINSYLRTDLTGDYWFKSDFTGQTSGDCGDGLTFCTSVDKTKMSALLLLANAYIEFPTGYAIKPYVGAGIGGAYVKWDDLNNTVGVDSTFHDGRESWRLAYALMAGASYCLTSNLKLDAGYRFTHFEGGDMFGFANGAGPGYDEGGYSHEVRGGLRYQFGKSDCAQPEPIAFEPAPQPIYK